tara:strand:- start:175 stop:354 length:180 start_codon:yes stop_codon:yes gene_type:complete
MIVLNIAEWIANLLILGLAALIWLLVIFGFCMLISMGKRLIDKFINKFYNQHIIGEENE